MSIAKIANGTLLKIGDGASAEAFTTVPEVSKLQGPQIMFDLLDVTTHDSAGFFREFIPGLADGERITATINWRPSNTVHKSLRVKQYARLLTNFKMIFPDSPDNTVTIATYVQGIVPRSDIGAVLQADITLKITGEPIWS